MPPPSCPFNLLMHVDWEHLGETVNFSICSCYSHSDGDTAAQGKLSWGGGEGGDKELTFVSCDQWSGWMMRVVVPQHPEGISLAALAQNVKALSNRLCDMSLHPPIAVFSQ